MNRFNILFESIRNNDFPILLVALGELGLLTFVLWLAFSIKKKCTEKKNEDMGLSLFLLCAVKPSYTVFTTIITLFPLMGMLGTVFGLLGLDMVNGDMENIKNNFFMALTSTAWGIVFAIIFKFINACIYDFVEQEIEKAGEILQKKKK